METYAENEIQYLNHALDELESYLLSEELFWPVTGSDASGNAFLKLTIGNLLLSLKKLETLADGGYLTSGQQGELDRIEQEVEATRHKWQVAWEQKADREFKFRFRQWGDLLQDIRRDFGNQSAYYRHEVRVRVLLSLLSEFTADIEGSDLDKLDVPLQKVLKHGDFIWEDELAAGFPEDEFWFLRGELRQ